MSIEVHIRLDRVYGQIKAYPVNDAARTFAAIAGTASLTASTLAHIRELCIPIKDVTEVRAY